VENVIWLSFAPEDKDTAEALRRALLTAGMRCPESTELEPRDAGGTGKQVPVLVLIHSVHTAGATPILPGIKAASSAAKAMFLLKIDEAAPAKDIWQYIPPKRWIVAVSRPMEPHFDRVISAIREVAVVSPDRRRTPPSLPGVAAREAAAGKAKSPMMRVVVIVLLIAILG